jgi:hypothetical protein
VPLAFDEQKSGETRPGISNNEETHAVWALDAHKSQEKLVHIKQATSHGTTTEEGGGRTGESDRLLAPAWESCPLNRPQISAGP